VGSAFGFARQQAGFVGLKMVGDLGVFDNISVNGDRDGDGMPDGWEVAHGFNSNNPSDANADPDGDGLSNLQEYLAGTDPTNPNSCLSFMASSNQSPPGATGFVVRWSSVTGKYYRLDRSTNLLINQPFDFNVGANIQATPPMNTETDTTAVGQGPYFYRIGVQ
jgi:hypothetical protein